MLEAAVVSGSTVTWTSTIANGTSFNGAEGAWYANGKVWVTTKGDNRVWELDLRADPNTIRVILIEPGGAVSVFLRVLNQSGSEIAGPAFSPDGTRLYFSSQRGPTGSGQGITYEVRGPFRSTATPTTTTTPTTAPTTTTTTAPATVTLAATGRTARKRNFVDLFWSGATTSQVEVRRNGTVVATTANDGAYTDNLNRSVGTFRYRISHPGGSPISNEVSVTF